MEIVQSLWLHRWALERERPASLETKAARRLAGSCPSISSITVNGKRWMNAGRNSFSISSSKTSENEVCVHLLSGQVVMGFYFSLITCSKMFRFLLRPNIMLKWIDRVTLVVLTCSVWTLPLYKNQPHNRVFSAFSLHTLTYGIHAATILKKNQVEKTAVMIK